MSRIMIKFYREENDKLTVVRTELCDSLIAADVIIEGEEGHYDYVDVIDQDNPKDE